MTSEIDSGLLSYLQAYPYPALVLDTSTHRAWQIRDVVWGNPSWDALCAGRPLNRTVKHECLESFWAWVDSGSETVHELVIGRPLATLRLIRVPCQSNLTVITSLTAGDTSTASQPLSSLSTSFLAPTLPSSIPPRDQSIVDCASLLEETDWATTSLGARETWSPATETMISVIMRSPTQDALWLGPEAIMVYNQHYSQVVKHPMMFGKSAKLKEAFGPVWPSISALIERCLSDGEPCFFEDDLLLYEIGPTGHFVEKYHTWSFIPIYDHNKIPMGTYNPTRDTTSAVLAARRRNTLQAFAEILAPTRTAVDFHEGIAKAAQPNPRDLPFIMCYSVQELPSGELQLSLESAVGTQPNHANDVTSPKGKAAYRNLHQPFAADGTGDWPFAEALAKQDWTIVEDCRHLLENFPIRQWDELPEAAIMVPIITDMTTDKPKSLLIMGLNLLCPFDRDYQEWVRLLRSLLVSSLRSVEAHMAEQQRRLDQERLDRAKTAWFQSAAHDLRTPLTLVAGPLDDVLNSELSPSQRHSLGIAQRNVSRIQRLTNALLDFSRIEAGKLAGRFVPTNLSIFVTDIAALFRPAIERMNIEFDVDVEDLDGNVVIDPTLLETAITNLLSNASKYTERGRIGIRLSYGTCVELVITDTGVGIPSSDFDTVLDRFSRAGSGKTTAIEGTGIGLALVKEIVRLHGGELDFTSRTQEEGGDDHGSAFTVRIPLTQPRSSAVLDGEYVFGRYGKQLAEEAMHRASPQDEVALESKSLVARQEEEFVFEPDDTLLVVDDTPDMLRYISQLFAPYCKVVTARNGQEALQMTRSSTPQLVLSDLMMPKVNGQQLLSALRAEDSTRLIPVILLSASTDEDSRLAAYNAGAEDFMLKPFKPRELIARVHLHMVLGKRRLTLERSFASRESEFKLLSDYCHSGIVRVNELGKIVYANAAWLRYAGLAEHEDPNAWADQLEPDSRERLMELWGALLRGDEKDISVTWKWRSGTTCEGRFLRLDRVNPGLSGILGCLQDISYQEERYHEAERRRLEAEESRRQQELLVDLTSHEIRTPVSAILQCSSLVKNNMLVLKQDLVNAKSSGFLPSTELLAEMDEDLEALESIYQCGLVQERIAADILSLGRVQVGSLSMYNTERDILEEARKVLGVFSSELKMKNIESELKAGDTLTRFGISTLVTDHVRLGQVVTNLVSNAIRFTAASPRRLITVTYDVALREPDRHTCGLPDDAEMSPRSLAIGQPVWLLVSVKDTGPGLSPQELNRLFLRFSQASDMIHSQYGGSGLGLYICKKITELLGGRIEVLSELGNGSDFRFFVQCRTGGDPQPETSSIAAPKPISTLTPEPQHHSPLAHDLKQASALNSRHQISKKILVVEDNIINQTVLKRQLVKAGYACEVANDGVHALEILNRPDFSADVVLMDLEMPIMNGFEAIRRIRTREAEGELPRQAVIALTGNARQWQIDQAMEAGMDDVMIKPYQLSQLLTRLDSAILQKVDQNTVENHLRSVAISER